MSVNLPDGNFDEQLDFFLNAVDNMAANHKKPSKLSYKQRRSINMHGYNPDEDRESDLDWGTSVDLNRELGQIL